MKDLHPVVFFCSIFLFLLFLFLFFFLFFPLVLPLVGVDLALWAAFSTLYGDSLHFSQQWLPTSYIFPFSTILLLCH